MAVIATSLEIVGTVNLPAATEKGKIYEHDVVVDTSVDNLASGDFLQLCEIPPEVVVSELFVISTGVTTATFDIGIADAVATTAVTSLFDAAALAANTVESKLIFGDTKSATPRILAAEIGTAGESTATITFRVRYRAA